MIPTVARGGRREGAGRKPEVGEPRDRLFRCRVTAGELAELHAAAEAEGVDLSDEARALLLDWARRVNATQRDE